MVFLLLHRVLTRDGISPLSPVLFSFGPWWISSPGLLFSVMGIGFILLVFQLFLVIDPTLFGAFPAQ